MNEKQLYTKVIKHIEEIIGHKKNGDADSARLTRISLGELLTENGRVASYSKISQALVKHQKATGVPVAKSVTWLANTTLYYRLERDYDVAVHRLDINVPIKVMGTTKNFAERKTLLGYCVANKISHARMTQISDQLKSMSKKERKAYIQKLDNGEHLMGISGAQKVTLAKPSPATSEIAVTLLQMMQDCESKIEQNTSQKEYLAKEEVTLKAEREVILRLSKHLGVKDVAEVCLIRTA